MRLKLFAALLACVLVLGTVPGGGASAASAVTGGMEGKVTYQGRPVAGAAVSAGGRTVRSGRDGAFRFPRFTVRGDYKLLDVSVAALGYGRWQLSRAQVRPNDTLVLTVELQKAAVSLSQPEPGLRQAAAAAPAPRTGVRTSAGASLPATHVGSQTRPPSTIRVFITGSWRCNVYASGYVKRVDFKSYVKHVLPNEWIPSWRANSLRAGAMAVKSYAWYWYGQGGKWPYKGADVMDSVCDQYYNPAVSYASTNAAVDYTWGYRLSKNGYVPQTQYYNGYYGGARPTGYYYGWLTQWGSKYYADRGYGWQWILQYYYRNTYVKRTY